MSGWMLQCLLPPCLTAAAAAAACQDDGKTRVELQGGAATKLVLPFVKPLKIQIRSRVSFLFYYFWKGE